MTIKPDPKDKEPAAKKPTPKATPKAKPTAQSQAKPAPATSTAAGPSGPDPALAARDMKRGLGGGVGFLWALLALAVAAGAGAATVDVWMPKLAKTLAVYQAPLVDTRLAPVAERVQALEKELNSQAQAREKAKKILPPPSDDMKEIVSRLTKMETRLAALDRKSTRLNSSHTDISRMPSSA